MQIFEKDGKINFVDENNVLVGFSNREGCCEHFGYFFSRELPSSYKKYEKSVDTNPNLKGYNFNPSFFHQHKTWTNLDEGGAVSFQLNKPDSPDWYLTLFNSHNGYYSHGFVMEVGGEKIQDDYL